MGDGLTPQQRKQILTTLRRLSETSTLYPHWFPLQGMAHQPYEGASGEFYDIRRGNYKGVDLSLRVLRVLQPDQVNKMFKVGVHSLSEVGFMGILSGDIYSRSTPGK